MDIQKTCIEGVVTVDLNRLGDERGFFARSFCEDEFREAGLVVDVQQCNLSFSADKGTLRGLHYQTDPVPETKLVRCTRGAILDVIVDLREGSATYLQHVAVELTADNRRALYVPQYFAHAFLTLSDATEVNYMVSAKYTPECEAGLRFDDPALAINWPIPVTTVSAKDTAWPLLSV